MSVKLIAPNGCQIAGTLDLVPGLALVLDVTRMDDGSIEPDWAGETKMNWDGQRTVQRPDEHNIMRDVYVDDEGNEWLESDLVEYVAPKPEG